MRSVRKKDIKNSTFYFLDGIISIKNLDPNKIKIDEKSSKNILIYNIGLVTSSSVKPFYVKLNGYIEKHNGNKYLTLACTNESKDTRKKNEELWNKIKDLIG